MSTPNHLDPRWLAAERQVLRHLADELGERGHFSRGDNKRRLAESVDAARWSEVSLWTMRRWMVELEKCDDTTQWMMRKLGVSDE